MQVLLKLSVASLLLSLTSNDSTMGNSTVMEVRLAVASNMNPMIASLGFCSCHDPNKTRNRNLPNIPAIACWRWISVRAGGLLASTLLSWRWLIFGLRHHFRLCECSMSSNAGVAANLSDLLIDLGNVPLSRVRTEPSPGTATEEDLLLCNSNGTRCELVDGILVEKIMGWRESLIALALGRFISAFVLARNLGLVTGPDGMMRILKSQVRGPDVAFVSWGRLPGGKVPTDRVPEIVPDLAVEVLSDGNTYAEMARKRREYFHAGVRQVWMVDINQRTVAVYHDITKYEVLNETHSLVGGDVLPGFEVSLAELFGELDRTSPTAS